MNPKIKKHLSQDPILKKAIADLDPLVLEPSMDLYNELVKSIAYQQISYKAADRIYDRLLTKLNRVDYLPSDILAFEFEELKSCGFSRPKTQYILNISAFFEEHRLYDTDWTQYNDQEIIDLLTQIRGVGVWTVQMILIFQLNRPDVFPEKDYGIQVAIKQLYQLTEEKTALLKKMQKIAEQWKPYRSFASRYLWNWKRHN